MATQTMKTYLQPFGYVDEDEEPLDKSDRAVDTPDDTNTMRQQNQDRDASPFKLFVEIEALLLGLTVIMGFFAFWFFHGK